MMLTEARCIHKMHLTYGWFIKSLPVIEHFFEVSQELGQCCLGILHV